jgi:iduronate 2-sulfatase
MRTDRYRLTRWVDRMNSTDVAAVELYDHQSDPQENTNIANRPENASLLKQLTEQWERGWQGVTP